MNIVKTSKLSASIAVFGLIGLLAACGGSSFSGKYVASDGSSYTFQSGNKVLKDPRYGVSMMGTYTIITAAAGGKKLTETRIHANDEDRGVLMLRPNGCLADMMGGTYCRH
ncbi:MAG: hypothetical protein L0I62_06645 [Gammaproteobacteria bacterium]|nr:hypothetical protein [Gammaproteobacteria bacterium]